MEKRVPRSGEGSKKDLRLDLGTGDGIRVKRAGRILT